MISFCATRFKHLDRYMRQCRRRIWNKNRVSSDCETVCVCVCVCWLCVYVCVCVCVTWPLWEAAPAGCLAAIVSHWRMFLPCLSPLDCYIKAPGLSSICVTIRQHRVYRQSKPLRTRRCLESRINAKSEKIWNDVWTKSRPSFVSQTQSLRLFNPSVPKAYWA